MQNRTVRPVDMTHVKMFESLRRKTLRWSGDLVKITRLPFRTGAPFDTQIGCDWDAKIVFCVKKAKLDDRRIAGIIHEMGHAFACTEPPHKAKNETQFLAWEWLVAKSVGLTQRRWQAAIGDYVIDDRGSSIDELKPRVLSQYIREMTEISKKHKLIVRGKPIAIR